MGRRQPVDNRKIGVFDSGLGGLTVVREVKALLPKEEIVYFGDTARLPYGSKSKESIISFSRQIMRFLLQQEVKAVIVACGTASSNALTELKESFEIPLVGVVEPGANAALGATKSGRIGVIGTSATVRSDAFGRAILKAAKERDEAQPKVTSVACPLFVPLVEEGWCWDQESITKEIIAQYMAPLKEAGVDTLILGCTHYPLLAELIQEEMGEGVRLINASKAAAKEMALYLSQSEALKEEGQEGVCRYYASDSIHQFQAFAKRVMGDEVLRAEKIDIEKY